VQSLAPLAKTKSLHSLNIDSTRIRDLQPLADVTGLTVLHANHTLIDNLQPLAKLPKLERIYCDQTLIKRDKADAFTSSNKNVLVIFDSKDLQSWWTSLPQPWQKLLSDRAQISTSPSKEELARVTALDSINISNQAEIIDLTPLQKLPKLQIIIANGSGITCE
jgi:hypothetical protein